MTNWRFAGRLVLVALLLSAPVRSSFAGDTKKIFGVFYRGCELACNGFINGIEESGFDAEVIVRDVAQDKSLLPGVVQEARDMGADLVLTWGTSVTLGVIGTLADRDNSRFLNDIPVVFTVVADPFGTGIAEGFDGSGRPNVTGTFNRVPESVNIEVIRQYDPTFSKLGLLYNSNEPNSVIKLEELRDLAPALDIELIALEIDPGKDRPDPQSIPKRLQELKDQGVRWVYLGSSSFLYKNGEHFTASAVEAGIAIVSPYENLVRNEQALLSVAARYDDVGRLAADQALRILRDGEVPGDLPIVRATDFAYVINIKVAKALDRFPPFAFLQIADVAGK